MIPERRDIFRLSSGFSATIKKLWNAICSMKPVRDTHRILPYITQYSIISYVAPMAYAMGRIKIIAVTATVIPAPIRI